MHDSQHWCLLYAHHVSIRSQSSRIGIITTIGVSQKPLRRRLFYTEFLLYKLQYKILKTQQSFLLLHGHISHKKLMKDHQKITK